MCKFKYRYPEWVFIDVCSTLFGAYNEFASLYMYIYWWFDLWTDLIWVYSSFAELHLRLKGAQIIIVDLKLCKITSVTVWISAYGNMIRLLWTEHLYIYMDYI